MLEGVVQIVCPHCDHDNRIRRERLRNPPPCLACRGALFEGRPVFLDDERRFDKHVRHNDIAVLAVFRAAWSGDSGALQLASRRRHRSSSQMHGSQLSTALRFPTSPGDSRWCDTRAWSCFAASASLPGQSGQ